MLVQRFQGLHFRELNFWFGSFWKTGEWRLHCQSLTTGTLNDDFPKSIQSRKFLGMRKNRSVENISTGWPSKLCKTLGPKRFGYPPFIGGTLGLKEVIETGRKVPTERPFFLHMCHCRPEEVKFRWGVVVSLPETKSNSHLQIGHLKMYPIFRCFREWTFSGWCCLSTLTFPVSKP